MTAPNPVKDSERPATTEAVAGRETASRPTTTSASAGSSYPTSHAEWMSWDDVTVEPVPGLAAELAGDHCNWCGDFGRPAVFRVHGHWLIALNVCSICVGDAVASAAARVDRVLVETAS